MTRSTPPTQPCECGSALEVCVGCDAPRCTTCDPYVTDDCTVVARAG